MSGACVVSVLIFAASVMILAFDLLPRCIA
jgi:hypothetical protein